jgi:branched-chain amino acid transport system permease protein
MGRLRNRRTGLIALGLLLVAFPLFDPDLYYLRLMAGLFIFVALAESWNMLGGYTGYISLGHVAFVGVGAYAAAIGLTRYGISPFLFAPLSGALAVLLALIIGYPTLRLRGPYFAVTTLSIAFLAQVFAANSTQTGGGLGISMPALPFNIEVSEAIFYWVFLLITALTVLVAYKVEHSRFGLALLAVRNDEDVAEVFGVNTVRVKLAALCLSAFFPGVLGAIYGYHLGYIEPRIAFDIGLSIDIVLMSLLGGSGRWIGPIIGASIVYLLSQMLALSISGELNRVIFGLILVVVIMAMPRGVLGLFSRRARPAQPAGEQPAPTPAGAALPGPAAPRE